MKLSGRIQNIITLIFVLSLFQPRAYADFDLFSSDTETEESSEEVAPSTPPNDSPIGKNGLSIKQLLSYKSSFHSLLTDESSNYIQKFINSDCLDVIQTQIKQGRSFYSKKLTQYSVPQSEFPVIEASDGEFHHYTTSTDAKSLAESKDFDSIFKFLRTEKGKTSWYLYAASDSISSSSGYGSIHLTMYLNPNGLIFLPREGSKTEKENISERIQKEIHEELIKKYPELSVCDRTLLDFGKETREQSLLVRLALEASGINAIAYLGINNQFENNLCTSLCANHQWMQIVGPWAIQKSFVKVK